MYKNILGITNAKTVKGEKLGYLTGILYLSPSDIVDGVNLCKFASKGCREACLYTAGRGRFSNVQQARKRKTELYRDDIELFMQSIAKDIKRVKRKSLRDGKIAAIRLNGTSDIRFEDIRNSKGQNIFEMYPEIQFYDYSKDHLRVDALTGKWSNYHLTFSMNESRANQKNAIKLLQLGVNVAVVFDQLPSKFIGYRVINGDETDLRFLDDKGVIVGLTAKGDAKKDQSGFVQRVA